MTEISLNSCRICINRKGLISINQHIYDTTFQNIISYFTTVNMNENDNLPKFICEGCAVRIENVHIFKLLVEESDIQLKEIFDKTAEENIKFDQLDTLNVVNYDENYLSEIKEHSDDLNDSLCGDNNISESEYDLGMVILETDPIETPTKFETDIDDPPPMNMLNENLTSSSCASFSIEKHFKCDTCGKVFDTIMKLKYHTATHLPDSKKPFQCNLCSKRYLAKKNLEHHISSVHEDKHSKNFVCSECSKQFANQTYLNTHRQRVHLQAKKHVCSVCNKAFAVQKNLEVHFRLHSGEKPYQCDYCDAKFSHAVAHIRHTQQHLLKGDIVITDKSDD